SLSAYARQFLEQMDKPDVDVIEGLSPAISIEQKSTSHNPRSTVGTVTEIYDYLRVLFARVGRPHCHQCGKAITAQTVQQMVDRITAWPEGSRFQILAPIVRGRKGEHRKELQALRKNGFSRVRIDGRLLDLSGEVRLDKKKNHSIEALIDRLVIKEGMAKRLADSLETALGLGNGIVLLDREGEETLFSEKLACIECGVSLPELTPRVFSFNNPHGACPGCGGLGTVMDLDPDLVIPDKNLTIREGAIRPWDRRFSAYYFHLIESVARHYGFDLVTPFRDIRPEHQRILLYGSGTEDIHFRFEDEGSRHAFTRPFEGVIGNLKRRFRETESPHIR
ncbi:MAG TPA: excinuclease ABC subunit UvrA, partial [Nitrospiria bacterium]|nr:excinuclease ABC subunit UvrA [Nitrospiria bacterium]